MSLPSAQVAGLVVSHGYLHPFFSVNHESEIKSKKQTRTSEWKVGAHLERGNEVTFGTRPQSVSETTGVGVGVGGWSTPVFNTEEG